MSTIVSTVYFKFQEFAADIAVCLDSWVGGIKVVNSKLHLHCTDGSHCIIRDPDISGFDVFDEKRETVSTFTRHDLKVTIYNCILNVYLYFII